MNGTSRVIPVLFALAAGFGLAWVIFHRAPPPPPAACPSKGNHTITVGPKASDLNGDECLKIKKHEMVTWIASEKGRQLTIEFEDEIFENMTKGHTTPQGKQLYVVDCQNRHCFSRSVKGDPVPEVKHKYWQFLSDDPGGGNPDQADGWIVIERP
jgi:hypothetical protein